MTQTADEPAPAGDPAEDPAEDAAEGTGGGLASLLPVRAGLAAGAVFVLGLLVGALVAGLLGGDPVVVESADGGRDAGAAAGPPLPDGDAAAQFVVSGACLGAVNAAQDTALLVDDVARGAAALDAAALDETVRRLMPLQTRLQTGLDACQVDVAVSGGGAGAEGSASPSAVPPTSAPATSPGG